MNSSNATAVKQSPCSSETDAGPQFKVDEFARPHKAKVVLILCAYIALIGLFAAYHEIWRDEMRALNIVRESGNFLDLVSRLRNEGHPLLWYALLNLAYSVFQNTIVLKLCALASAGAAAAIFLLRAPFPLFIRALWLAGFYPAYEYSVMCRNYGVGMLCLFAAAACYDKRIESPWKLALCLSLAALTSAYGIIHVVAFSAALLLEPAFSRSARTKQALKSLYFAGTTALVTAALSLWTIIPEKTTTVTELHSLNLKDILHAAVAGAVNQGASFHNALVSPYPLIVPLVLLAVYALLLRTPAAIAYLFSVVVGMEMFNSLIYSGAALRHQGFLLLGIVVAIWLSRTSNLTPSFKMGWLPEPLSHRLLNAGVAVLLTLQLVPAYKFLRSDLMFPRSSSAAFANFVRHNASYENAVIAAEPDVALESLPYYLDNSTYLVREKRFGSVVSFTSVSNPQLSLNELISELSQLSDKQSKPVLLLLPPQIGDESTISVGYGRTLEVNSNGLERLNTEGKKLTCFEGALTDENYCVWLINN
ncbi:MAG: hypothetical protein KDD66_18630 [Bdellovibrionales bacterium]|nr:hypothetical protein [Bdellovibrionales bacterium]